MHKVVWARNTLRAVSALHRVPQNPQNRIFRRNLAWLREDNEYLPNLLAEGGFVSFLDPLEGKTGSIEEVSTEETTKGGPLGSNQYLHLQFKIDRNAVCIDCSIALAGTRDELTTGPLKFHAQYPAYTSDANPPDIPKLVNPDSPKASRIKELADTMWRSFCVNDFLTLSVEATLHPDGSMSFPRCSAQVDESAVHRQADIFKHVARDEHADELEAEKSLLVYRRYTFLRLD
jgi:hypothetical protein